MAQPFKIMLSQIQLSIIGLCAPSFRLSLCLITLFTCEGKQEMDPRCVLLGAHWLANHKNNSYLKLDI